ncbi:putative fluoride ion transporter CrcB [Hypericibacter terrae]|uniref:Fluoride-specific ion channel FluC n=1 Tax=Hypericibacter terrae TaxID=2602015 RepID=A0A5J6MHV5_9PROT|nr:fluoride efflux transporter CrcB [Hypericibacter terrae]QEX16681.1 putative fluoride ion transporter CrcB [Hypericibacter terrae]
MMNVLIVFVGAGIGGSIRHGVNLLAARLVGMSFPYGTLSINIVGSMAMGLCAAYFAFRGADASQPWRLFLTTGILGGFTTFSAFSLDVAVLWERGDMVGALLYVLGSVILSLLALFLAMWLARSVLG